MHLKPVDPEFSLHHYCGEIRGIFYHYCLSGMILYYFQGINLLPIHNTNHQVMAVVPWESSSIQHTLLALLNAVTFMTYATTLVTTTGPSVMKTLNLVLTMSAY